MEVLLKIVSWEYIAKLLVAWLYYLPIVRPQKLNLSSMLVIAYEKKLLETEELRVRPSRASLLCVLEKDTLILA